MSKFKVGDRVRRVAGYYGDMHVGACATVEAVCPHSGNLDLREFFGRHAKANFELVADAEFRETTFAPLTDAELIKSFDDVAALSKARKDDSGKLDMNLLDDMPRALKAVVEVMQWAIVDKKPVPYVRGSWLGVECDRYRAAIKRHERSAAEQATPEVPARFQRDAETNLLHLAHTACSAMMALENAMREQEKNNG